MFLKAFFGPLEYLALAKGNSKMYMFVELVYDILVAIAIPVAYKFLAEYQKARIEAFLHPDNLGLPGNYNVWQSKVAIGSGGVFGKGLFKGTQKSLDFIPVQQSDFIYSVIVEELGFIVKDTAQGPTVIKK